MYIDIKMSNTRNSPTNIRTIFSPTGSPTNFFKQTSNLSSIIKPVGRRRPILPSLSTNNNIIKGNTHLSINENKLRNIVSTQQVQSILDEEFKTLIQSGLYNIVNPNATVIAPGQFGKIYLIKSGEKTLFLIKLLEKREKNRPTAEQYDVNKEKRNILYINEHMSDRFMIKQLIFEDNHKILFVSKFLEGYRPLNTYLDSIKLINGIVPNEYQSSILFILRQLNDLFEEMKNAGIIHRDAHFNNILIDPETKRIKLIDYGLCSILNQNGINELYFNRFVQNAKRKIIIRLLNKMDIRTNINPNYLNIIINLTGVNKNLTSKLKSIISQNNSIIQNFLGVKVSEGGSKKHIVKIKNRRIKREKQKKA